MILPGKRILTAITFIFIYFSAFTAYSQPVISFQNTVCFFQKIADTTGSALCSYHFTNSGNAPLQIYDVRVSGNSAEAEWDTLPIAPLQSGNILIRFNPKEYHGLFYKSIRVLSNTALGDDTLYMGGEVVSVNSQEKFSGSFFQLGNIKFSAVQFNMDTVLDSEIEYDSLLLVNVGLHPISLTLANTNNNISITLRKNVIDPGEKCYILISYNPFLRNEYGNFFDRVSVTTNDSINPDKSFSVRGFVKEDFSMHTAIEIKNAPVAEFDKYIFELGSIRQDEKVDMTFLLKNTGKSDLVIRKIKPACGCTVLTNDVKKISAGASAKLQFVFDPKGKSGQQDKKIMVITNDPLHSILSLSVKGNVLP